MFVVDAHEDIALNALCFDRDVRYSLARIRELEAARVAAGCCAPGWTPETALVSVREHQRGGIGLVFATVFTLPRPQDEMTADAEAQIGYYHDLADTDSSVKLVGSRASLRTFQRDWSHARNAGERPVGLVLLLEGADSLPTPDVLPHWQERGLRIVGPAWQATKYAGGTGHPGPLTPAGRALLRQMDALNMILDTSHLAEESFWQALESFDGPVIASHSNCRALVSGDRHLSDAMIRALAERDAVIGMVLANAFIVPGWELGQPVTLDDVIRHVDHVCQITGSSRHCGIGSDFDGGFGIESTPDAFESVADLPLLADALARHGYSEADIEGIMGGNWLRFLAAALPPE